MTALPATAGDNGKRERPVSEKISETGRFCAVGKWLRAYTRCQPFFVQDAVMDTGTREVVMNSFFLMNTPEAVAVAVSPAPEEEVLVTSSIDQPSTYT